MSIHLITGKKGEPHVTSQNQGIINSMLFGVGKYVFDFGSNFETYVYNNTVTIKDGQGLINGRHFEIEENTTESVVIENGEVGSSRYDLIVARYTKDNQGFEDVSLEVIKGESVRLPSVPTEPTFSDASILEGAILTEFPLYRVEVVGVSELTVTPKFEPKNVDLTASLEDIAELSDEVQELIDSQEERIASKIDRIDAPKIFYGSTEPTNLVADYPGLMLGDLYFQWQRGTGSRDIGEIQKIWMAGISPDNEDMAVWREITTSLSAKWSNYYTKTQADNLLTDKLNRNDGIKFFESFTSDFERYVPSTNIATWGDDIRTGDINIVRYTQTAGDRKDMYIAAMYIANRSGNNLWWKKLYNDYNQDWYSKSETDTLLNAKQNTLTAGNNIVIDVNNVIKAKERSWKKVRTIVIDNDNAGQTVDGVTYGNSGDTAERRIHNFWFNTDEDGNSLSDYDITSYYMNGTLKTGSSMTECGTKAVDKDGSDRFLTYALGGTNITSDRTIYMGIDIAGCDVAVSPDQVANSYFRNKRFFKKISNFVFQSVGSGTAKGMTNGSNFEIWMYGYWDEEPTRKLAKGTRLEVMEDLPTMSKEELEKLENVETDVSDSELNKVDDSEVKDEVLETEKKTKIDDSEIEEKA